MHKAYHLDLSNTLPLGTLELQQNYRTNNLEINQYIPREYPNGISRMGQIYLGYVPENNASSIIANATEYIFETVRRQFFPHRPSRLQAIFTAVNAKDIEMWFAQLMTNSTQPVSQVLENATIKTIAYEETTAFIADAMWRDYLVAAPDGSRHYSAAFTHEMAMHYWSGEVTSPDPRLEIVIPLPAVVEESIPLKMFATTHGLCL